jgi:hypothetical protein
VRGLAVIAVIGVAFVTSLPSSAAVRDPRLEHLALSRADMQRASGALLRESDLVAVPPGWRPLTTVPDADQLVCAWQNYSQYTLTGRGEADFQPIKVGNAGFVGSSIDVLASPQDALGKFSVDTHPGTVTCEAEALRKALGAQLKTVLARQLPDPELGERAIAYEFVYEQPRGTPKSIYAYTIEFVRGRSVAVLSTTNFDAPGDGATRERLARLIDDRLGKR